MAEENNHAAEDGIDQEDIRNLHIDGKSSSSPPAALLTTICRERKKIIKNLLFSQLFRR